MKAPDKIYIPIVEEEDKRLLCTIWWEHDRASDDKFVKETVPYIRKDALLEFMNKKLQESADRLDYRTNKACTEILDRLNEM